MKIQDPKGVWLVNRGQFRFIDGENGTVFEPQEPTKALRTQWVKNQAVIVRCIDPTQENTDEAQAELDALNAQDAQERGERMEAAEKIMAVDNARLIAEAEKAAASPQHEEQPSEEQPSQLAPEEPKTGKKK